MIRSARKYIIALPWASFDGENTGGLECPCNFVFLYNYRGWSTQSCKQHQGVALYLSVLSVSKVAGYQPGLVLMDGPALLANLENAI